METLIGNLVDNAIKYSRQNGRAGIILESSIEHNSAIVRIFDSGPGIPENEKENIFKRNYRLKDLVLHKKEGSGIGLFLANQIAKECGANIEIKNLPDEGPEFDLILSGSVFYAQSIFAPADGTQIDPDKTQGLEIKETILVIEDDPDFAETIKRFLNGNYRVEVKYNAPDALEYMRSIKRRENYPSLILSDLVMPGMDGMDMYNEMKKEPAIENVPFIFLSADAKENSRLRALDGGVIDYLKKPVNFNELKLKIDNILQFKSNSIGSYKEEILQKLEEVIRN